MAFVKKEGKRRILNYQTKNFLVVIKFSAVVALSLVTEFTQQDGRKRTAKCLCVTNVTGL